MIVIYSRVSYVSSFVLPFRVASCNCGRQQDGLVSSFEHRWSDRRASSGTFTPANRVSDAEIQIYPTVHQM